MKTLFKLISIKRSLFILYILIQLSGYSQIPTNGLIGCYPFSGNANDYSGNGHDATVHDATLTVDRFNRPNNAYSFDGFASYIELNANSFLLPSFTYAAWVQSNALPGNNSLDYLITIGNSFGSQNLCLFNNYSGGWTGWGFYGSNSGGGTTNWDNGTLPGINTWYHIAVTRSNSQLNFYINGQHVGTVSISNHFAYYGMGPKRAIIGSNLDHNQKFFHGVIDDIHIYDRALSPTEINSLYNAGTNAVTISANPGTTICVNESVTFTAITAAYMSSPVYKWQVNGVFVGSNTNTYTSSTLTNGSVVKCLVSSDCEVPVFSNSLTMSVNNITPLNVSISSITGDTICHGDNATFEAISNLPGTNPVYQWKINNINVGTNQAILTVDTLSNGAQISCILTSSSSCVTGNPATSNVISIFVQENLPLNVSINATPGSNICRGDTVIFTAIGENGGSNASYQWKINGLNVGGNQQTITTSSLANEDIITCIYTSSSPCVTNNPATSNSLTMVVKDTLPLEFQIVVAPGTTVCKGTNVHFKAQIIGMPANGVTCQWKLNDINVGTVSDTLSIDSLLDGDLVSCIYTTTDNCYTNNPATEEILIHVLPSPTIDAGVPIEIGVSEGVTLNTIYEGGAPPYQFNWTPEGTLSDPHSSAPYATPSVSTEYYVEIFDSNGCSCRDSVMVSVFDFATTFFVPNAFSPNDDQENDVLYVRGKGIQELKFIIYDRWGKEVFSTSSQENGWDGKFNGKKLNPATFIYYIKVKTYEGKIIEKKGNVTLVN